MIFVCAILALPVVFFLGFTIWWLRAFPVPPLVDIQNSHRPTHKPRPLLKFDWMEDQLFPALMHKRNLMRSMFFEANK